MGAALTGLVLGLGACGSDDAAGSSPVVDWLVVPGRTDQAALADTCAREAGGDYTVRLHELPANIDDRHTDLVRRLSGANSSVDVLSLETPLIAEMSGAGFLAPLSATRQATWGEGVAPGALKASTNDGRLVAAPWWFDPQLLWYRGATAERAGLDVTAPITWDDLIAGADRLGVTVQIDDLDGSGTSEWVAALVTAGGGDLLTGLDTGAGRTAAAVVESYRESRVGPGPSASAIAEFTGANGGFLLAPSSAISATPMQAVAPELAVAAYPVISTTAPAPAAGISLAVSRDSANQKESADLISCLVAPRQQRDLVLQTGHAAARTATFDDDIVQRDSPTAAVVKKALATAQPVPVTPYWATIQRAIDRTWRPISQVTAAATPQDSQREVSAAVAGKLP